MPKSHNSKFKLNVFLFNNNVFILFQSKIICYSINIINQSLLILEGYGNTIITSDLMATYTASSNMDNLTFQIGCLLMHYTVSFTITEMLDGSYPSGKYCATVSSQSSEPRSEICTDRHYALCQYPLETSSSHETTEGEIELYIEYIYCV